MRRLVVSVLGAARLENQEHVVMGRQLGAALVEAGFRIVTGGLGGMMEAVSYGARHSPSWSEGSVVGIVPSYAASEANPWCDLVIPSGMQIARNILVVSSADVVVAVGGGSGTLSEIAIAWQLGRPIVSLGKEGWAGRVAGTAIDSRHHGSIRGCSTVQEVVDACLELAKTAVEAGDIGSGWRKPRKGP